jgi:3,4-dihydroxy 2-butanone 4-phosphate synthase/GTP cyclohydrolase II
VAILVRHGSGIVRVPMTGERVEELRLPPIVGEKTDAHGTAFTFTVDHVSTGTAVSAADRVATVRARRTSAISASTGCG